MPPSCPHSMRTDKQKSQKVAPKCNIQIPKRAAPQSARRSSSEPTKAPKPGGTSPTVEWPTDFSLSLLTPSQF